jgi:hypothetical protein
MGLYKLSNIFQLTTIATVPAFGVSRTGGWSEGFWVNGDPNVFLPLWSSVQIARARMLPAQASIVGTRAQAYTISQNKLLPGGTSSGTVLVPGNPAYPCDVPQMNYELPVSGSGVPNSSRLMLRGIPDQFVTTGEFAPTRAFGSAIQAYIDALRQNGFAAGWIGRNLVNGAVRVISYKPPVGANPGLLTTDAPIPGFANGNFVRFHRVRDDAGNPVKGSFSASSIGGNQYNLATGPAQTVTQPSGTIRLDQLAFINYGTFNTGEITVRKVGKPTKGFRGRRSKSRV